MLALPISLADFLGWEMGSACPYCVSASLAPELVAVWGVEMAKLVCIDLLGDLESGCWASLKIFTEGDRDWIGEAQGKLPACLEIRELYSDWQERYLARVAPMTAMRSAARIGARKRRDASIPAIKKAGDSLNLSVDEWLSSGDMSPVKEKILLNLTDKSEDIRFIFKAENPELLQLPWHSWHIFKYPYYVNAEPALYLPVGSRHKTNAREKVKVLAVFGKRETVGKTTIIKIEKDWEMLQEYLSAQSNAQLVRLVEPTLEELGEQVEKQSPQILFFAGHSNTEEDGGGSIELNQEENISIDNLQYDLRDAIERGLQLAIFNSCDGLGIARQLEKLDIPNIIVMRESVPDEVAQKFLQRFLEAFASGKPLHIATRKARERMARLENKYPGASGLPVIFQNPAEPPLTWQGLGGVVISRQRAGVPQPDEGSRTYNQDSIVWLLSEVNNPPESERKLLRKAIDNPPKSEEQEVSPTGEDDLPESQPFPEGDNSSALPTPPLSGANRSALSLYCSKEHTNPVGNRFCIRCGESLRKPTARVENSFGSQSQEQPAQLESSSKLKSKFLTSGFVNYIYVAPSIPTSYSSMNGSTHLGSILAGRYRIISTLASGGFSKTYLAEDKQRPGHPKCVVKQLHPPDKAPFVLQTARRLFDREAEVLEELGKHPQIPQLFACFEENKEFYLVQEFIEGKALSQELLSGSKWPEPDVVDLLQDVLAILDVVHGHNVIHRDIKPSNLIRRKQDGKLVLIDFGAVKRIGKQTLNSPEFTHRTVAIGTPGYRPLEQAQGRPRHCSDIYALGMVAIQALTGVDPLKLMENYKTGDVIWHQQAEVNPKLARILDKMVRCDFKERYQSAAEVLQDLERLANPAKNSPTWLSWIWS